VEIDQPPSYTIILFFILFVVLSLMESVLYHRYRFLSEKNLYAPYWFRLRSAVIFSSNFLKVVSFILTLILFLLTFMPVSIYIYYLIFALSGLLFILMNLSMHYTGEFLCKYRIFDILIFPLYLLSFIIYPLYFVSVLFKKLFRIKKERIDLPQVNDSDVKYITDDDEDRELEEREIEMIKGIYDFRDMTTVEIMVPRVDLIAADVETSISDLKGIITKEGHSRIPIYEETIDNIIGIVHAKDLLEIEDDTGADLKRLIRDVMFVPETKKLNQLLMDFQREKSQLAIVVDEYGGVSGIVTIEDIIEEIVGEIQDEYDEEEELIRSISDRTYLINPKIDIGELNEILGIELPDEDYETLGGFIYDRFERVPQEGDRIEEGDIELIVDNVDDRRIHRVRLKIKGKE